MNAYNLRKMVHRKMRERLPHDNTIFRIPSGQTDIIPMPGPMSGFGELDLSSLVSGGGSVISGATSLLSSILGSKTAEKSASSQEKAAKSAVQAAKIQAKTATAQSASALEKEKAKGKWVTYAIVAGGVVALAAVGLLFLRKRKG